MSDPFEHRWDPRRKPPPGVCPQRFCFCWLPKGSLFAPGMYTSLDEAMEHPQEVTEDTCGCSVGICTRLDPVCGDHDWYEPCEPELENAGLPWFYFIPTAGDVVEEHREQYQQQSRALWGDDA